MNLESKIGNRTSKMARDSAECADEGGSGDQVGTRRKSDLPFEKGPMMRPPKIQLWQGESILKGALDLGEERGCQTSQPLDHTPFIDGFNLFGHGLGRKRETSNSLGYDRVTGREVRRVLGQGDNDHKLAELIDAIIG
jgi:hypothetical protein